MSTKSDSPSGGADDVDASGADPDSGDLATGFDAAEAAGFGGITWADELEGEPSNNSGSSPTSEESAGQEPAGQEADGASASDGSAPTDGPVGAADGLGAPGAPGAGPTDPSISVEDLVVDLERVTVERDQYLDASRRLQAEFENYRKAVAKREVEARERANESLVLEILPVLDACDSAVAAGATDVEPVRASLTEALTKQGLARIDDLDGPFDPERHQAVMHDPDEDGSGPVVAEVMRAGYSWKGRVVRPAMVRVRG